MYRERILWKPCIYEANKDEFKNANNKLIKEYWKISG